jgi:hypothetical protein
MAQIQTAMVVKNVRMRGTLKAGGQALKDERAGPQGLFVKKFTSGFWR